MKEGIHPEFHESKFHCNGCGAQFTVGSTSPEMRVVICSNCHPFYTGKQKFIDTQGRIDRFKARYDKMKKAPAA